MQTQVKSFAHPDETRHFQDKGWTDVVSLGGRPVAAGHFEPGWRWSVNVKPIAGTDLCRVSHLGYCLSGRMRIHMEDGSSHDLTPGSIATIPAGHDAEVLGDEECVLLDFGEISEYAQR